MVNISETGLAYLAKLLIIQARQRWCDCDTPCSCFELEAFEADIHHLEIRANGKLFKLAATLQKA